MGADIYGFLEVKKNGKWEQSTEEAFEPSYGTTKNTVPFDWRSYSMFGFLAGVRNYSNCLPISEPKGLPEDSEYLNGPARYPGKVSWGYGETYNVVTRKDEIKADINYHSLSFLTLEELMAFDYDATFEDLRYTAQTGPNSWNGAAVASPGNGKVTTYREYLGEAFFGGVEVMKTLGTPQDVRFIFWFG